MNLVKTLLVFIFVFQAYGQAQAARQEGQPRVGKAAAMDYFKTREANRSEDQSGRSVASERDRVLMLYLGTFINDKAYRWGSLSRQEDVGKGIFGVNYRVGEWRKSMDLYFRAEFTSYEIDDEKPLKFSVMPIVTFPDVRSDFPLYFGAGLGPGIFFKQTGDESDLALDYALLIGARFLDIFETGGLFFETGLKGQVHLLSSGQHDGVFLSGGGIFSF